MQQNIVYEHECKMFCGEMQRVLKSHVNNRRKVENVEAGAMKDGKKSWLEDAEEL
jgi:hypothetical protein